ncbi:MAG TPA: translocation/assembly module TamB domain-containing protein, partial [Polyangia bacterium]|nr:translocation/assembly module TamB domain-containing protein [Polyangia bacterium]
PLAEDAAAQLALTVAPSDAAGVHLESARVVARADGPRWTLSSASARGAGVSVLASGEGEGARLAADLRATLEGRPPHPPGGGAGRLPDIRGGGALAVHVEGTWPDVEVTAHGQVAQLRAGAARVGRATLEAHVRDPVRLPAGHLTVRARGVRLGGEAPALDSVVLSATGDRRRLRVDGAVAGPRVRGNLRARGTLSPSEIDVALQALALDFTTARYRQTLDLKQQARVRFRPGDSVRWEGLAVHGAGFRFTGDLRSDGVYRFAPAGRRPVAALTLALRQAAIDGFNPVDADLDASLSRQRAAVKLQAALPAARAQVRLDADLPLVVPRAGPPRLAEHGDVHVDLRTNEVHLETLPVVEKALRRQGVSGGVAALSATINGDIAHPDARLAFDLRDVMYRNIRGHGRDSRLKTIPGLGGSLTVETPPGAVRATAVLRIRNAGVLTADARLAAELRRLLDGADVRRVPVTATIGIPGFALASLADFTDELKGLSGQLSGQLHLTGTLARPSGTADLQIDGAKVDDLAFRDVRLQGQAGGGRVSATLNIVEATGGTLTGSLALDRAAGDRLQATARGQNLDLRFLRPFVATAREIAGQAQLSATVGGTLAAPQIDASLTVDKGRLGLIGQPTFSDVRVAATLKPGRADLTTLEMRSGSGSLSASGWVGLDGFQPRRAVLRGHAHRFLVAAAGSTGALVDGDFAADAVLRRDLVSGAAQIPRAQVWLPKGPGGGGGRDLQKIGAHDDVRFVDEAARAAEERQLADAAAASPRRIDLGVRTGTVYVRGKDLDIELDSTLKLGSVPSGPRTGAPTLSGGIHIRRGRINIQGQRFDFDRGDVNFDGSPDFNPRLDIVLQRQYSDARVVVQLTGTPRKPELKLTSDPPIYDQAQIVSLILTGQPGGQPSTGKSFDPTAAVATAVLSRLADQIAPEIGLDVLRVESVDVRNQEGESTGATDMRVELGKYISDRIYVSYAHVFGAPDTANQNEAHVEYRVTRRWMVETIFGDAGVGGVDALWTLRY